MVQNRHKSDMRHIPSRALALLLAFTMLLSLVTDAFVPAAYAVNSTGGGPTGNVIYRRADPDTTDTYADALFTDTNGSRYAGRVWTDKTVFAYDGTDGSQIPLDMQTDGYDGSIGFDADFAHVFSALTSSQIVNEYPRSPIDLVIVFDMSASMGQDTRFGIDVGVPQHTNHDSSKDSNGKTWPEDGVPMSERIANSRIQLTLDAINSTIDGLMKQNPQNRVAVCAYGANATVLMPLAHWRRKSDGGGTADYLTVGGMETLYHPSDLKVVQNEWRWNNNRDTCYTVVVDAYYNTDTTPDFSEKNWVHEKRTVSNNINSDNVKAYPGAKAQDSASMALTAAAYAETSHDMFTNKETYRSGEDGLRKAMAGTYRLDADEYIGYFTNTQGGIYLAYQQLAQNDATTYTEELTYTGKDATVARIPAAVIMSDGGANFAFNPMGKVYKDGSIYSGNTALKPLTSENIEYYTYDEWAENFGKLGDSQDYLTDNAGHFDVLDKYYRLYSPTSNDTGKYGNIGDEWYNVWLPGRDTLEGVTDSNPFLGLPSIFNPGADIQHDGTLTSQPGWYRQGVLYSSDNSVLGTSGTVLEVLLTASYMSNVVKKHYENGWHRNNVSLDSRAGLKTYTMNVDTDHVPLWGRMRLYPTLDPREYSLDNIEEWCTDTHDFGTDEEVKSAVVADNPVLARLTVTTPRGLIFTNGIHDDIQAGNIGRRDINSLGESWKAWKEADDGQSVTGVMTIGNPVIPIEINLNKLPAGGMQYSAGGDDTVTVTNQDVIDNIAYNDKFFDVTSSELSSAFEDILTLITGQAFSPVSGSNASGASNSVTYQDPLGDYMEIKNGALHGTGSNAPQDCDMALLAYGELHGLVRTGVYDYSFNEKHIENGTFEPGWYSLKQGGDPDKPEDWFKTSGTGSWENGDVYHLDAETLRTYVPTLHIEDMDSSDISDQQKNTAYTVYRFTDQEDANKLRINPVYGDKVPDDLQKDWDAATDEQKKDSSLYAGTPGVYRLNDIRVWVEEYGDYVDTQGAITPNHSAYDASLYMDIPAAAVPTQIAEITLGKDGVLSYKTNLEQKTQCTPIRLFYAVGLLDRLILRDRDGSQTGVDISALSEEYISSHRDKDNNIYFISNFYSNTPYDGYTESDIPTTRGDPAVSFSPSSDNRYYIFQKPLPVYAHAYRVTEGGNLRAVDKQDAAPGTDPWTGSRAGNGKTRWEGGSTGGAAWSGGIFAGVYENTSEFEHAYSMAAQNGDGLWQITDDDGVTYTLPTGFNLEDCVVFLRNDLLEHVTSDGSGYADGSISFASEDYFFLLLDYYVPTDDLGTDLQGNPIAGTSGATHVQRVVTRKGSEFGSGLNSSRITNGDMLCWTDLNGHISELHYNSLTETGDRTRGEPTYEKLCLSGTDLREYLVNTCSFTAESANTEAEYWEGIQKSLHDILLQADSDGDGKVSEDEFGQYFHFAVAARPGGLRVGDMYQNRRNKSENITGTSDTYYVPTIHEDSGTGDETMISNYLGNNGRLAVADQNLLVTKTLKAPDGFTLNENHLNQIFNYQVYIQGVTGTKTATAAEYNEKADAWQRKIGTIDVLTDNSGLLTYKDGSRVLILNQSAGENVMLVETAGTDGTRTYCKVSNDGTRGETVESPPQESLYYVYLPGNAGNDNDSRRIWPPPASDSGDEGSVSGRTDNDDGSQTYWVKNAELIPYATAGEDWSHAESGSTIEPYLEILTTRPASATSELVFTSPFNTRTSYVTKELTFGVNSNADGDGKDALHQPLTAQDLYDSVIPVFDRPAFAGLNNDDIAKNTAEFTLKHGEGLLFTGLQDSRNYRFTEKLKDDQTGTGYVLDNVRHAQQYGSWNTYTQGSNSFTDLSSSGTAEVSKDGEPFCHTNARLEESYATFKGGSNADNLAEDGNHHSPGANPFCTEGAADITQTDGTVRHYFVRNGELVDGHYDGEESGFGNNRYVVGATAHFGVENEPEGYAAGTLPAAKLEGPYTGVYSVFGNTGSYEESVHYTNSVNPAQLRIRKELKTAPGAELTDQDKNAEFEFTLKLEPSAGSPMEVPQDGWYEYAVFNTDENGQVTGEAVKAGKLLLSAGEPSDDSSDIHASPENTWSFKLKGGQEMRVSGIPVGTEFTYTVTEKKTDSFESSASDNTDDGIISEDPDSVSFTGTISDDDLKNERVVVFSNTKQPTASLNIRKIVTNPQESPDPDQTFTFNITLEMPYGHELALTEEEDGSLVYPVMVRTAGATPGATAGTPGRIILEKSTADGRTVYKGSYSLKHGQTLTFENLPDGTEYHVTEESGNYSTQVSAEGSEGTPLEDNDPSDGSTASGKLSAQEGIAPDVTLIFSNTFPPSGTLSISKVLKSQNENALLEEDYKKDFHFTLTLSFDASATFSDDESFTGSITTDQAQNKYVSENKTIYFRISDAVRNVTYDKTDGSEAVSYSWSFTLKGGQTLSISGLPVQTGYAFEIEEAISDSYDVEVSPEVFPVPDFSRTGTADGAEMNSENGKGGRIARGTIGPNENSSVHVTFGNVKKTGNLSVSKTVTGSAGNITKDWHFSVTLSNTSINGTFGDMTFTDGVAEFTLKSGETKTATGLPAGITYTVTEAEANQDGYTTSQAGDAGTIPEDETAEAEFTNDKQAGDLTVSKTVTGNAGDATRDWHFSVTLSDTTINGTYGDMTFTDGVAEFTLKSGETKTATDLPAGITYTVTETEANQDGYTTAPSGDSGTITEGGSANAEFTNSKATGSLSVAKTVDGPEGDKTKDWHFTVTLSDTTINGTFGDMTFVNGVAEFTLKSGETKTATDLPAGITYSVTETEANQDGYTTTPSGDTGTVSEGGAGTAQFTNTKPAPKLGNLSVTKSVTGDAGDTAKDWHFTVTLSDTTINGTFGDMTFVNGAAEFTLKHGETKTATGLPAGITYTVTETEANQNGYTTTPSGDTGTVPSDSTAEAEFINDKQAGDLKVTKTVTGKAGNITRDWHFTVTLSDTSINGTYGDMTFVNGAAEFTLKHGETKTATGLPAGITYTVTETEANQDGYTTTPSGDSGIITDGGNAEVGFTNDKKAGNLTVSKTVTGNAGDITKDWHFTVTLSDTTINGTYGDMTFVNGAAEFTLKHGETKTATGLPADITYTVTETEANQDGYATTSDGDTGTISDGGNAEAGFTNDRQAGNLTVSKTVTGNEGDTTRDWHFTVTLSDTSINGTFGDMTFINGVAEFTLKSGESKAATGLPAGIAYTVTEAEANQDGYTTTPSGDTGTVPENSTGTAQFTNAKPDPEPGNLSVTKSVTGDAGDTAKGWHFTVTLSDTTINGTYGDMTFTNGVAEFTLKSGETKTATGLPAGITYTVTEAEANQDGYTTTPSGDTGTVPSDGTAAAEFVNDKPSPKIGSLSVKKTVTGEAGDKNKDWHFTVTLSDTTVNGTYGDMTFTDGVAEFTLKHGETKTATGLPAGITYTVTEIEADQDGYTTSSTGETGTIPEDDTSKAEFKNNKPAPRVGNLTVSKTVTGPQGDPSKDWHFRIELSDKSISGIFGDMTFINGVAEFTLKSGESKTATGLPAGITYTVTETEANQDGYTTSSTGETGTIPEDDTSRAEFTNNKPAPRVGNLTVSKTVTGPQGDPSKDWHFRIELSDKSISGVFGDMSFTDGVAEFTLKHGETKTATGLPAGITYTVTEIEADQDGYATTPNGDTGIIPEGGNGSAQFTNAKPFGGLSVSKTVEGTGGDKSRDWHFRVELSDKSISGVFGDMSFTDGVAEFTLRHGETKTATGLPAGITYTVTETEADQDGYITVPSESNGTIPNGGTAEFKFTNKRSYGGLTVTKTVTGDAGDRTKEWHFTVTLSDRSISGTYGEMTFTSGVAEFALKDGETRTATGLPAGITYTVTETEADQDGYTTTPKGDTGTIPEDSTASAEFTNSRPGGSLSVTKTVTGTEGEPEKDWHFTVTLSDSTINGTYGEMTFRDGVAEFTLKSGESKTATGLPAGITYTVTEAEAGQDGYATTPSGDTGTVPKGGSAAAKFVNHKPIPEPETGNLTVSKKVTGSKGDTQKEWHFRVELSDSSVSGTFGEMVFTDGVSEFTLRHNESKTAIGLPGGITYTVTELEANQDGYRTSPSGENGTIPEGGAASAEFVNDQPAGSLTVTKTVTGTGDRSRDWHFTVTLSDTSISGTYGNMTFTDGVAEFTLKHGESRTADGLPAGITYTVVEEEADLDGYRTTQEGAAGAIPAEEKAEASFTNHRGPHKEENSSGGGVSVGDSITYSIYWSNDTDASAVIQVKDTLDYRLDFESASFRDFTLRQSSGKQPGPVRIQELLRAADYADESDDVIVVSANVQLESGPSVPVTISYSKSERTVTWIIGSEDIGVPAGAADKVTLTVTVNENAAADTQDSISSILRQQDEPSISNKALVITNDSEVETNEVETRVKSGNLTVKKTVAGSGGDKTKEFHFTVTLSDTSISGQYGGMYFTDGIAEFTLKHGETITADGLPEGITYTVTEAEAGQDGYSTSSTGDTGRIPEDGTVEAEFTNRKDTETGSLAVSKRIAGDTGDRQKAFSFKVTLSDTSISGTFGDMTFVNGVAAFTLKHGETKTATGLPAGVTYTVTEEDASQDGYKTSSTGETGTVPGGGTASSEFVNMRMGSPNKYEVSVGTEASPDEEPARLVDVTGPSGGSEFQIFRFQSVFTGDIITYDIYWINSRAAGTADIEIVDPMDPGLAFYSACFLDDSGKEFATISADVTRSEDSGKGAELFYSADGDAAKDYPARSVVWILKNVPAGASGHVRLCGRVLPQAYTQWQYDTDSRDDGSWEDPEDQHRDDQKYDFIVYNRAIIRILNGLPAASPAAFRTAAVAEPPSGGHRTHTKDYGRADAGGTETYTEIMANPLGTGSITISKQVEVPDSFTSAEKELALQTYFGFTLSLSGSAVLWDQIGAAPGPADVTFSGDTAAFRLKDGESITFTGIPLGTRYSVEETVPDGPPEYTPHISNASGVIDCNIRPRPDIIENDTVESISVPARNVILPPETGSLTVSKTVTGSAGDLQKEWHFRVELSDRNISGTYGDMTFTGGVAEFTLKHGESKTASGLPAGVTYTVSERESDQDGYATASDGATGTVPGGGTAEADFVNHKAPPQDRLGGLTVSKTVTGSAGDRTREWHFRVELSDPSISGRYGDMLFVNGVAEFTLRHGETMTATGLPAGITYRVIETEADTDGYASSAAGETGQIPDGGTAEAEFVNRKESFGLTVTKTVAGEGDRTKEFHFRVELSDPSISGSYGDMTFKAGVAEFTLKHGESLSAWGLPEGVSYTVTEEEANQDGYHTFSQGESGTITSDSATAAFVNSKGSGDLTVTKTVSGKEGDYEREFHFRVELSDPSISGTYGSMTFTDGVAEFTLKHGESLSAWGLPEGVSYTVTEEEANQDGYHTFSQGESGTITSDSATASFVNSKGSGDLAVTKTVAGSGDQNRLFRFLVVLDDTSINGTYGGMTFTDGVAEFSLRHGESMRAAGLPSGTGYTVTELDANTDGYHTDYSGATGTIADGEVCLAEAVNTRFSSSLTVSKTVTGSSGERDRYFTFTVTLDDPTVNGMYGDMTFVNGVARFQLKHGESASATGLPGNTGYRVTEAEANTEGYTTSATGDIGVIPENGTAAAEFTNSRTRNGPDRPDVPQTGDSDSLLLWTVLLLLSLAGLLWLTLIRRPKKKKRNT